MLLYDRLGMPRASGSAGAGSYRLNAAQIEQLAKPGGWREFARQGRKSGQTRMGQPIQSRLMDRAAAIIARMEDQTGTLDLAGFGAGRKAGKDALGMSDFNEIAASTLGLSHEMRGKTIPGWHPMASKSLAHLQKKGALAAKVQHVYSCSRSTPPRPARPTTCCSRPGPLGCGSRTAPV